MVSASLRVAAVAIVLVAGLPLGAAAQVIRGTILDQTGLPLPGATVEVLEGTTVTDTLTTAPNGTFEIPARVLGSTVRVKLVGFETMTVPRADASRVVLPIARASSSTEVVASMLRAESPTSPLLGNTLTATNIARMPSSRLKARESLPLLPSVVRGSDGLLRLGGARPSESPLLVDGFDVTDPATGISSLNLPFEAVQGVEFLRDPMSVAYGTLMGGVVKIESRSGGDRRQMGVQGFVPRPRFQNPGAGRIEGIFPRFFMGGAAGAGRVHYFGAIEYDFERITVPEVTQGSGPNIVEKSATVFGRVDIAATSQTQLILEGFVFPSATDLVGLSPRRDESAAPNVSSQDLFGGFTSRTTFGNATLLTVRAGVLSHDSTLLPGGRGPASVSPSGWRNNWFSHVARRAVRYSLAATLERSIASGRGSHDITLLGSLRARRLRGTVAEESVLVENEQGDVVRGADLGQSTAIAAQDWPYEAGIRDLWRLNDRFSIDGGVRVDGINRYGAMPSARAGVRYALDDAGLTVVKGGVGNFVGKIPLAVPAFSGYPMRIDRRVDEVTGISQTIALQPTVNRLRLPHAMAVTLQLERQIRPGLDAQIGHTRRRSTRLATLDVPPSSGPLAVASTGITSYRELQVSARQTWAGQQQLFVSYVWSSSRGELNDFMASFGSLDAPLLQPGGSSRLPTDARHRWIAWGTVNLPRNFVFSPVMEWHSGFPFSPLDARQLYLGTPNSGSYPAFTAVDLIAYKTVTYRKKAADVGIQLFNLTNHFNPRDVYPVKGARDYGRFTNSVGPILRGSMMIKW